MVFKCQEDSFLKEYITKVISCEKTDINGYAVILEDTILFPEGGGQPSDHGYINNQNVQKVVRKGDKVIHYIEQPLNVGENVKLIIDWDRRFDHMQQHSGQHLITAVIDRELKFNTVSWWLGENVSYIELDTPNITLEQIKIAENLVNQYIREARTVTVQILKNETSVENMDQIRSARGLPRDHIGDIRVITISGIESNMCCGTHVTNLSQLQVIKLLHSEKSKRKDKVLLYFCVGNRVINKLHESVEREQLLANLLKSNPAEHVELVYKLITNGKLLNKNLQSVLKDLAIFEAKKLKNLANPPKYFCLHRKEAELDFINTFLREFGRNDVLVFLSVGDEKGIGNFVINGDANIVVDLGPKICELLYGKGNGKGNRYQARVTNMSNRNKAIKLIENYFE